MQKQNEPEIQNHNQLILYACMFFITPVMIGFSSFFCGMQVEKILGNVILSIIGIGLVVFLMLQSDMKRDYLFDNAEHKGRFCITYVLCLFLLTLTAQFNQYTVLFPYMTVAALFLLFSNFHIGLMTYVHFMMVSAMICRLEIKQFVMYLALGVIGICLLRISDKCFKPWWQAIVVTGQYILLYSVIFFLPDYHHIDTTQMFWYGAGAVVNLLLMLISFRIIDAKIVHKYQARYLSLNNPEHELMIKLKEFAKNDYYNAIHTAYLSERLAKQLNCNDMLAKTGGLYHKIGVLRSGNRVVQGLEIGREYQFPPQLLQLLCEYDGKQELPTLKESVIVMLSDAIVSTIQYFHEKDTDEKPDYDKIIEVVFKKKYESGILEHAAITFEEYHQMKDYFKSEELYYDFLRR